mmetsp:Transcript_89091/g.236688  ORF Transcript_89091/g.236688 Transcript_89091/m.236688 type:complete len:214 (+) Transcript_89091:210-851(+)
MVRQWQKLRRWQRQMLPWRRVHLRLLGDGIQPDGRLRSAEALPAARGCCLRHLCVLVQADLRASLRLFKELAQQRLLVQKCATVSEKHPQSNRQPGAPPPLLHRPARSDSGHSSVRAISDVHPHKQKVAPAVSLEDRLQVARKLDVTLVNSRRLATADVREDVRGVGQQPLVDGLLACQAQRGVVSDPERCPHDARHDAPDAQGSSGSLRGRG